MERVLHDADGKRIGPAGTGLFYQDASDRLWALRSGSVIVPGVLDPNSGYELYGSTDCSGPRYLIADFTTLGNMVLNVQGRNLTLAQLPAPGAVLVRSATAVADPSTCLTYGVQTWAVELPPNLPTSIPLPAITFRLPFVARLEAVD